MPLGFRNPQGQLTGVLRARGGQRRLAQPHRLAAPERTARVGIGADLSGIVAREQGQRGVDVSQVAPGLIELALIGQDHGFDRVALGSERGEDLRVGHAASMTNP